ncbi:MAG TPA: DivIVA domain-containing protein [Solirubrobacteraceae bacterium]
MPDQSSAATEHAILAEITRPLESLPDDALSVVDADFPSALRGYERVAVDEYVRQTRQLVAELQATRSPEAAVRRALERVGEQISGILQRAHETAEQITAQSRREAEDRLQQARVEATQIADAAERRVRDLDTDTDRIWLERQRIVADAEDLAAQLLALARTAADRFPADADADAEAEADAVAEAEPGPAFAAYDEGDEVEDPGAVEGLGEAENASEVVDPDETEETEEGEETPVERSEIEQTVAFRPLEAAAGGEKADAPAAPTRPGEDDTAVIPPASQAANRRQNP